MSKIRVIGEINTGHFGNLDSAFQACDAAKKAGASHIKFQSWRPESLFTRSYLDSNGLEKRMYERFSLSPQQLLSLSKECHRLGIGFGSTAYSQSEVEWLAEINSDFIKIASMDIVSPPIIRAAAAAQLPTIISTGMASMDEIKRAVHHFQDQGGNDLTILHCTSVYPTPLGKSSLGFIKVLQSVFPEHPIGFSDHTQGVPAAAAALCLGARIFEKHFTLDSSRPGFDNAMAESEESFADYVTQLEELDRSIQVSEKEISAEESSQALAMRRSAFFVGVVQQGEELSMEALEFKRPGTGLSYEKAASLVGRKLKRSVSVGELLQENSLEES